MHSLVVRADLNNWPLSTGEIWWGANPGTLKSQGRLLGSAAGANKGVFSKRAIRDHESSRLLHVTLIGPKQTRRVVHFTAQNQIIRDKWVWDLGSSLRN